MAFPEQEVESDPFLEVELRTLAASLDPATSGPANLELARSASKAAIRDRHRRAAADSKHVPTALRATIEFADIDEALRRTSRVSTQQLQHAPDVVAGLIVRARKEGASISAIEPVYARSRDLSQPFWRARASVAFADACSKDSDFSRAYEALRAAADDELPNTERLQQTLTSLGILVDKYLPERRSEALAWLQTASTIDARLDAFAVRHLARVSMHLGDFDACEAAWARARHLQVRRMRVDGGWTRSVVPLEIVDGAFCVPQGVSDRSGAGKHEYVPEYGTSAAARLSRRLISTEVSLQGGLPQVCAVFGAAFDGPEPLLLLNTWGRPVTATPDDCFAANAILDQLAEGADPSRTLRRHRFSDGELEQALCQWAEDRMINVSTRHKTSPQRVFSSALQTLEDLFEQKQITSRFEPRDYLSQLVPGLAPLTLSIARAPHLEPHHARALITFFWTCDLPTLPSVLPLYANPALDRARDFLKEREPRVPSSARAQARASTLIEAEKVREATQANTPRNIVDTSRNAAEAARSLFRVGAFRARRNLVDGRVSAFLSQTAEGLLALSATELLQQGRESYQATKSDRNWQPEALANAADAMRGVAESLLADNRYQEAAAYLRHACEYFAGATRLNLKNADRRLAATELELAEVLAVSDAANALERTKSAVETADSILSRLNLAPVNIDGHLATNSDRETLASTLRIQFVSITLESIITGGSSGPEALRLADRIVNDKRLPLDSRVDLAGSIAEWCLSKSQGTTAATIAGAAAALTTDADAKSGLLWTRVRGLEQAERNVQLVEEPLLRTLAELLDFQPKNGRAISALLNVLLTAEDSSAAQRQLATLADASPPDGTSRVAADAFFAITTSHRVDTSDASTLAEMTRSGTKFPSGLPEHLWQLVTPLASTLVAAAHRRGNAQLVHAASQLLTAANQTRGHLDWWGSAARLALSLGDRALAAHLIATAPVGDDSSSYESVLYGRLLLLDHEPDKAASFLASLETRIRNAGRQVHPSVLGFQARAALQSGEHDQALQLAEQAVEIEPNNPISTFCLGRIARESGDSVTAADAWLRTLRIQTTTGEPDHARRAMATARSLARITDGPGAHDEVDRKIAETLLGSDLQATRLLAGAIASVGRVRGPLCEAVLPFMPTSRRQAEILGTMLMAGLIEDIASPGVNPAVLERRLRRISHWAQNHNVLASALAGSKRAFARAAIRRRLRSSTHEQFIATLQRLAEPARSDPAAQRFLSHLRLAAPLDREFLEEASRLLGQAGSSNGLDSVTAAAILQNFPGLDGTASLASLVALQTPYVALDTLLSPNGWDSDSSPVAYFDATAVAVLESVQAPALWSPSLDLCERPVDLQTIEGFEEYFFRSGIRIDTTSETAKCVVSRVQSPQR